MSSHVLDNPVWHALTTQHAGLAITADGAAKYPPAVAPFGAVEHSTSLAADQLTSLLTAAESIYLVGVAPPAPRGWLLKPGKPMLQMVCGARIAEVAGPAITRMTAAHCDDMLALTALVFPGFFRPRTLEMGDYIGIYDGARLVAMAGERMRLDGYQEMSAVCTHPDYTGRGYAQRLLALLCNAALDRGFTPFLHVYSDNTRAIEVYRKLGFVERTSPPLWSLQKAADISTGELDLRPMIALETERLALTQLADRDADFIVGLLNEPSFLRYIGDRGVRSADDARRYIREGPVAGYERYGYGLLRVALRDDDTPIGMCGVLKRDTLPDPDLGFSFLPAWWSRGYALEAATAVMQHVRGVLRLGRILAITTQDNEPSIRLLGKLGFRFERMIRLGDDETELRLFISES